MRKSRKKSAVHHETKNFFCTIFYHFFLQLAKWAKKKSKIYFSNQKFEFFACNIKNWNMKLDCQMCLVIDMRPWEEQAVMQNVLSTQKCYCLYLAMSIYRTRFEVMSHQMGRRSTLNCCKHKKCISKTEIWYRLMKSDLKFQIFKFYCLSHLSCGPGRDS